MIKVLEKIKTQNHIILVCELFDLSVVTDKIKTSTEIFLQEDFYVDDVKACFSAPSTRNIVIKKDVDCSEIKELSFV